MADFSRFVVDGDNHIVGKHLVVDFWGIRNDFSDQDLEEMFYNAATDAGATVLQTSTFKFGEDGGTTGALILAESHLSWHHYPESNAIFVDLFTCGTCEPERAIRRMEEFLEPLKFDVQLIRRGKVPF